MKKPHLVALALAAIVGFAQGCETQSCSAVGWQEGLTVKVTSDEPLTAGAYRFVIEIPEQTFEVNLTLENPKNTQEGVYVSQHIERDYWQVNASLSGSTQFGTEGDITIGRFKGETGGPKTLTLTVFQDGVEIGALELGAIDYHQDELNGSGCGVATTANTSISIAPVRSP